MSDPVDHIRSVAERGAQGAQLIAGRLARGCWPSGTADTTRPVALHWLRRWRPERLGAAIAVCSCAAGRCAVCN